MRVCRCSDGYNVEDVEELFARKDARIAELEVEKYGPGHHCHWTDYGVLQKQRAEKAETTFERLKAITPEQLAEKFHATYEGAADVMGYRTRRDSAVAWEDVPKLNKSLMVATCMEVLAWLWAKREGGEG